MESSTETVSVVFERISAWLFVVMRLLLKPLFDKDILSASSVWLCDMTCLDNSFAFLDKVLRAVSSSLALSSFALVFVYSEVYVQRLILFSLGDT